MEKKPQLVILLFLVSLASVGAVFFSPGLPSISEHFSIPRNQTQLSVTLFLVGYACGQLFWAPFSNRWGRKPTLFFGLGLQMLGAIAAAVSGIFHFYPLFIFCILVLALGSSVGLQITFTLIGDAFTKEEATKKIAYLGLSFAITPGLGVALGGFIVEYLNWESCFFFLAIYGALIAAFSYFLPETNREKDLEKISVRKVLRGYLAELKNKQFLFSAITWGLTTSIIYLFAQKAPFIGIEDIGLAPDVYGLFNFIPLFGLIFGLIIARKLVGKTSPVHVIGIGLGILSLGVYLQLLMFYLGFINQWSLFLPMIDIYFGSAMVFTHASGMAVSQGVNKSNASSVMNFVNMGTAVSLSLILSLIPVSNPIMLPLFFAGITLLLGLLVLILRKQPS